MKKILVIDDEKPIRDVLRKFLTNKGYTVFDADNAESALALLVKEEPPIVLLDIRMPKTDGLEILKKIKEISPATGVIMITAVSDKVIAEKCIEIGAFDYITKPVSLAYLEECLLAKMLDFYK